MRKTTGQAGHRDEAAAAAGVGRTSRGKMRRVVASLERKVIKAVTAAGNVKEGRRPALLKNRVAMKQKE